MGERPWMSPSSPPRKLRIDLVSDVVCPWCIVGYRQLERALEDLQGEIESELHWHPFELNPRMPREGQNLRDHILEKYGSSAEDSETVRTHLTELGDELDFNFRFTADQKIYNTFDAHRLIAWADPRGRAHQLKMALFESYFSKGEDVSDHLVLKNLAAQVGLDPKDADQVLRSDAFATEVRAEEAAWQTRGISGVPAFILEGKYLITGAQGEQALTAALRQVQAESQGQEANPQPHE